MEGSAEEAKDVCEEEKEDLISNSFHDGVGEMKSTGGAGDKGSEEMSEIVVE